MRNNRIDAAMHKCNKAADQLLSAVENTICKSPSVEAPKLGKALRDLILADVQLYFEPVTAVGNRIRKLIGRE